MSKQPLRIYGVPFSVHTRKVIIAARLKAIPHEVTPVVPVVPERLPPDWRAISPTGLIPAIDDEGYVLADSTAILHYLERRNPAPALFPADARDYGTALFLDAWAGHALFSRVIHPLFHNEIVNPNIRKTAGDQATIEAVIERAVPDAFDYLERLRPRRFLVGSALSIADLAVVSNLILFHYLGRRIDSGQYPLLAAYFDHHRASLASVLDAERPFVASVPGLTPTF